MKNFFHHINNLHQKLELFIEEESNGELAFLDTLLRRNNGKISVLVYRKPTNADQYQISPPNKLQEKHFFPPCLMERIPLSPIKMT